MARLSLESLRGSVGAITFSAALLGLVAAGACGGKQDLNFVGADGSGNGGTSTMVSASCGDRVVDDDDGEECDDGDRADNDGCSGTCTVEDGWTCTGEPSVCVACGNEVVEEGEECDDGNDEDGDGCDSSCKIEGSCAAPAVIELSAKGDGLVGSATSRTGSGESGQVAAADCGSASAGDGADRIFEFELPRSADLTVSVGANFDAVVRLLSDPCDLDSEIPDSCANEGAVGDGESVVVNNAPAGTYYVVVDGSTSRQAGDFSVNVEAHCPLEGLKIQRVILGEPFRTSILNTNDCAIDLSRVGVYAQPEAADSPRMLPAITLQAHRSRLLTSESPPPTGTTYQGNIRYDLAGYAGAFYLCRGECDSTSGANVIDAFRWRGDSAPTIPSLSEVTFDGNAAALADRATMSYYRTGYEGAAPDFVAGDYVGAYMAETFEDHGMPGWVSAERLFFETEFATINGTVGDYSFELTGANANWKGWKYDFVDSDGDVVGIQPSLVTLQVRGSDKAVNHGEIFFGQPNAETGSFGSFFRSTGGSLVFGNTMVHVVVPYQVETWYALEYSNFDWTAKTAEVSINGAAPRALPLGALTDVRQLNIANSLEATVWVDQIIVQ